MNNAQPIPIDKKDSEEIINAPIADDHRKRCYWDVIYDKNINLDKFKKMHLDAVNEMRNNGDHLKHYVIHISSPESAQNQAIPNTKRLIIEDAAFDVCDFLGDNTNQKITFKNCEFRKVYFGHSVFNDVNFENCTFKKTSFALAKFSRCSFNEKCKFKKVSISGGKTVFEDTTILSSTFIQNAYIYATQKYCDKRNLNIYDQEYRMYSSLVKLSRNIITSVTNIGDDDIYYDAIKTLFKLRIKEKESKIKLDSEQIGTAMKTKKKLTKKAKGYFKLSWNKLHCILFPIEKIILSSFGFINGWGNSFIRCIGFGFLILVSYTILYTYQSWDAQVNLRGFFILLFESYMKSLDVTLLVGYTKYSTPSDSLLSQFLVQSNMLLGLAWYGVSLPTLINKISMARI